MGDLEPYMDENFISRAFATMGETVMSVKIIRNRLTGIPAGYCFVEFADLATAEKCLHKINGKPLPGATPAKRFKLNYATYGKQPDHSPEYSLFVGDLTPDVDDGMLYEFFVKVYPSCRGGKVVLDQTGVSKGYGFVKFTDELEQKRALTECQGAIGLGSKPVRLSVAIPKASRVKPVEYSQMYSYSYNQYYQQYQNYCAQWGYDRNTGSYSYSYPQYGYTQSTMQTDEEVADDALEAAASKNKVKGSQGQFPLTQNVTVVEGGTAILTCRVDQNDNTSLQWSNPAQQTLYFDDKKALRDNRIELVRASWHELSISVSDVSLSDEGQYTCSLFTMPVKTSKAYLTVLGVPEKPQISGFSSPVMEGDLMQLTCKTSGSKPAADIRWFKNDKEIKDVKYLKEEDANRKTFTVSSTLDFRVDRSDDGVAVICRVDHESLNATPQVAMQVLEIHYTPSVKIIPSTPFPQEGQPLILTCESKGKPLPEPVLWTKDGGELPDPDRMVVSGRELNILFLNKTDNGTYRCEATNTIGQSSAEYVLIVHDVPNTLLPTTIIPSLTTETVTTTVAITTCPTTSATTSNMRDPNALAGQTGPDHALIGGIVAVVVFVTLCSIFLLGRYLARHKGTYLTNEAKGAEDAPDADTAIINAEGSQVNAEEKKEYFI